MIIISGCSWGVGEWGKDPRTKSPMCLTGPGLGQLISLHGKVVNLSEASSSNTQQLNYLADFLKKFKPDNADTFYWIVTDPLRCFIYSNTLDQLVVNQDNLENAIRFALDNWLQQIDQLASDNNIHINLIGGLCDLDTIDVSKYTRLKIVVPSWGKLLDSTYASSIFYSNYIDVLGKLIYSTNIDLLDEWHCISELTIQKRNSMERLFKNGLSDDVFHPNRYGHRILRDYLMTDVSHIY